MGVQIKIDLTSYEKALKEYAGAVKKDIRIVLRDEMRKLTERLIELTPPFTGKGKGTSAKLLGENAVSRDIQRVFYTDQELIDWIRNDKLKDRVRKLVSGGNYSALRDLLKNISSMLAKSTFENTVKPSAHIANRDSRGRVFKRPVLHFVPNDSSVKRYIKSVMTHVGRAKAGWWAAAKWFGAKNVPLWVRRHGTADGYKIDITQGEIIKFGAANTHKSIISLNQEARIMAAAISTRERDVRKNIEAIINPLARRASRKTL